MLFRTVGVFMMKFWMVEALFVSVNMFVPIVAMVAMMLFMAAVWLFGLIGVGVAVANDSYRDYLWVPGLLMALSTGIIFSTSLRLIRRFKKNTSE